MLRNASAPWIGSGLLIWIIAASGVALCDDGVGDDFFERHVRPILAMQCASCHDGSDDAESVLALDGREALIAGGDFGPAIVPGSAEQSLLWRAVNGTHKELRMPPDSAKPLNREQVDVIAKWINDGAAWPKNTPIGSAAQKKPSPDGVAEKPDELHWSFRPRRPVDVPQVAEAEWNKSDIDRFVWQKLQANGLRAAPVADKRTLVRRMYFDLIGLPPSPREMDEALTDDSPDALANLVDRLLESPHYGERWGRHWLDVARYADTQGDVGDIPIPQAYVYRNWVVDALNADMPYDQFVQWQLAGDMLAKEAGTSQPHRDMIAATGFLALSRRFGNDKHNDIHLVMEDTIDTVGRGLMGVTLRCARCHDHKFDAMTMSDYYGLYGIFASTRYPWMGASDEKSPSHLVPNSLEPRAQQATDEYWTQIARYEYQINNHFRPWLAPTLKKYEELKKQRAAATANSADATRIESEMAAVLDEHEKFRELLVHGLDWLRRERNRLAENPPYEMLFAASEGDAHDARLHRRGDPNRLGEVVPRGFIEALGAAQSAGSERHSGRLDLAHWITSPEHPLTARVIVNRVWQHHFGRGLVATASDFGTRGSLPSHPELLDYLASSFVAEGWSLKKLHRRLMLSRTYQLACEDIADNETKDPENIYLWKFARRRLDAEAIRDAMLATSGQLDRSCGGPHPFPAWHQKGYSLNAPFKDVYDSNRRSVYLMTQRLFRHPFLDLFDGPDRNASTEQRKPASIATQALFLMNSPFVHEQAEHFGQRIEKLAESDEERVRQAYRMALARDARDDEIGRATEFVAQYRRLYAEQNSADGDAEHRGWAALAKVLLTSNEFFFID